MVIKSFEPPFVNALPVRGKDIYSWKRKIFQDIEPYHPHSQVEYHPETSAPGFDFLIVFDPLRFLVLEPEGIREIMNDLYRSDPGEEELIISTEKTPFFAISSRAIQKINPRFHDDKELIEKLRNSKNVRMLSLEEYTPVIVPDVTTHLKAVEDAVLNFQIGTYCRQGVIFEDFGHFFIEGIIPIGAGTRIASGVVIKGDSKIGKNVRIDPHCFIENSSIADDCVLLPGCIVSDSLLEADVQIGPYTHLRNNAQVKSGAKMGNFVEMKKSILGEGSKAMHLTYIGDAQVGKKVNIGAGTITCNYDGVHKHPTVIEDNVFVGSGTELVAPVVIRKNSYIGAGSTITEEVPQDSLAVARQKQRNIPGWVTRKKNKNA